MGAMEDEAIGALLHDLVEDRGGPQALEAIRRRFGDDVARIVAAKSDTDEEPKTPWRARKEVYIAAIAHKRPDELRVSLADKLHNALAILLDYRTHGEELWARFKTGEGASVRWYYRSLFEAFLGRAQDLGPGAAPALEELGQTVRELESLAVSRSFGRQQTCARAAKLSAGQATGRQISPRGPGRARRPARDGPAPPKPHTALARQSERRHRLTDTAQKKAREETPFSAVSSKSSPLGCW